MKKTLKLVPAIAMLLISAIMLSTATFAWFSMNNRVQITGMTLKTKVSSNLLVSETNVSDSTFTTALEQSRSAYLEPASTVNGSSFYYTVNAKADGSAIGEWTAYNEGTALTATDTFANKENYDPAFNSKYAFTTANPTSATQWANAYAYIDYDFYLKATSTEASQKVAMTFCNLLYNGKPIGTEKAWRVAVFASAPSDTVDGTGAASTLKTILAPTGAAYQKSGEAVTSTSTTANVSNLGTAATIATLNAGDVKYFHVVVRLWLEGEDKTCTNQTFASLTNAYSLSVDFVLSTFDGVINLQSVAGQAVATRSTTTANATLNTSDAAGCTYQWYDNSTGDKINLATSPSYTGSAGDEVYCIITTTAGTDYRTNPIELVSVEP